MNSPKEKKELTAVKYIVKGDPIPLARARWAGDHMYDTQKQQKLMVGIGLVSQHNQRPPYTVPVQVDFIFCFKKPKHRKLIDLWHDITPDLSNLIKFYEDVATEAGIWNDDKIIAKISAIKMYGPESYSEFTVTPLRKE